MMRVVGAIVLSNRSEIAPKLLCGDERAWEC